MNKTGVLLINLGTPDSPSVGDVRRYLTEFLNDPRVIDIPWIKQKLLVNGAIVPFRAPQSAKIYRKLWELGNGESPLLTYGKSVLAELNSRFETENVEFELAMRYGKPSLNEVCARMEKAQYDKIIIFPMFPQYASSSSGSAIEKAMRLIKEWWVIPEIEIISQFYDHPGYIDTVVARAGQYSWKDYDHVLFSYHGLPVRQVTKVHPPHLCEEVGCKTELNAKNQYCYTATCYATTRAIAAKLGMKESDYTVCFQSRLNDRWLNPFSDKVVEEWAAKGAKKLLVFSPAFVADCLETLVEIGYEYQMLFEEKGGEKVQLVESLNDHPLWLDTMEQLVRNRV